MRVQALFPTYVYQAPLQRKGTRELNRELLKETAQICEFDVEGQKWSRKNYRGGYTSYGSIDKLHQFSSTFMDLEKKLNRHVAAYAKELEYDLEDRPLVMTDCWVNVMPQDTVHGLHLHPTSTISGTYYVKTPKGCSSIKFEDPRLANMMAAPPRKPDARRENQQFIEYPAEAGNVVLFESWLRHEVASNPSKSERVSISFNYNWF
ncbi:MAG: TIGR02466 family protein [Limisphaerales bacterium]